MHCPQVPDRHGQRLHIILCNVHAPPVKLVAFACNEVPSPNTAAYIAACHLAPSACIKHFIWSTAEAAVETAGLGVNVPFWTLRLS